MNCPKCLSTNLKKMKHKNMCLECNFEFFKNMDEKKCKYCDCSVLSKLKDYYKFYGDKIYYGKYENEYICHACNREQFVYKDK